MKQPEQTKERKTADLDELIEKELIQKCKALQEENERLKENLDYWRENERDRIHVLEEALREARTFITEADDDGEGKEDWIILKTIEQALTGSQSKD